MPWLGHAMNRRMLAIRRGWGHALLLAALAVCATGLRGAQKGQEQLAGSEQDLRVAFLFNFAKFIDWPPDAMPPKTPINLCILGDSALRAALEEKTRNQMILGHAVVTLEVALGDAITSCHVLYAARLGPQDAQQLTRAAAGKAIFTVSNSDRFAQSGGVANLFRDNSRMRIAVNLAAAQRARLQISSRLLSLATIVTETLAP